MLPGIPVNCSATEKLCDRYRCTLRARFTSHSYLPPTSSSIPMMAMISCKFFVTLQYTAVLHRANLIMLFSRRSPVPGYGWWNPADPLPGRYPDWQISRESTVVASRWVECRCRRRVCQVIRRHIHSLYRCDGSFSRRSDSLLKCTHLCCKSWLVTYCRRHTSEQSRTLPNPPV